MKGFSNHVELVPVAFEKGLGVTLTDVDGNTYLDFSSGICVSSLGHCHPKVGEAISRYTSVLMNCHDFTTPVKLRLLEKLAEVLPGDLNVVLLHDSGATAIETALRICRAATGKGEFISGYRDCHGKTGHAASLARMGQIYGPTRAAGFYMVPRPDPYRPLFVGADGNIDTDAYLRLYDEFIQEATTGQVAAFVLEPVQGWGGSIVPPNDFFPKLRKFCDQRGILLLDDEVLSGMGRTGKWLAMEHWNTVPDVVALGKGLGNGFPMTAVATRRAYGDSAAKISPASSYGGNPLACAAALACIEVIEQEGLLAHAAELGEFLLKKISAMKNRHLIIGDVRGKGCLLSVELVKDRVSKEPFEQAGQLVYQRAFQKGLACIPARHILTVCPPIVMEEPEAGKGVDILEEAIAQVERDLGCNA